MHDSPINIDAAFTIPTIGGLEAFERSLRSAGALKRLAGTSYTQITRWQRIVENVEALEEGSANASQTHTLQLRLAKDLKAFVSDARQPYAISYSDRATRRNHNREIYVRFLNDFARAALLSGESGADALENFVGYLSQGKTELRTNAGFYELWSTNDRNSAHLIAELPHNAELTLDDFHTPPDATPALGSHALDRATLKDSPTAHHFWQALKGAPEDMRFADLFKAETFEFAHAPDPTPLLQASHRANAKQELAGPTSRFRIKTYNVALVDVDFGPFFRLRSPNLDERAQLLPDHILSQGQEIIMLQEVLRKPDLEHFLAAADRYGYRAFHAPRDNYNDGLLTLIKKSMIKEGVPTQQLSRAYDAQKRFEAFGGGLVRGLTNTGVKRGYQKVTFEHPELGRVHLFNTHMTPFASRWETRLKQARQFGLAMHATDPKRNDILLAGGDLNSGPYYPADSVKPESETKDQTWFENTTGYAVVQHYSGTSDLAVMGRPYEQVDDDVQVANAMHRGHIALSLNNQWPMTVNKNSNELYRRQYGDTQHPARIDHVFGRLSERIRVHSAAVEETDDLDPERKLEPSDHYAVELYIEAAPPKS